MNQQQIIDSIGKREVRFRAYRHVDPSFEVKGWTEDAVYNGSDWIPKSQLFGVVQYTGLKDKNGKEIWEGDILSGAWGFVGCVHFDGDYLQYRFVMGREIDYYGLNRIEVVGNIFENPELLPSES